ncbi:MAG: hypothetical protein AAF653_08135, partial [Chloroflexota bacterium]
MRSIAPLILLVVLMPIAFVSQGQGQAEPVGPLLASVWNRTIRVHDLGGDFEWVGEDIDLRVGHLIWSPDGCYLLVEKVSQQWVIIS